MTSFPGCAICSPTGAYAGAKLRHALAKLGQWTVEIVKRSDHAAGVSAGAKIPH